MAELKPGDVLADRFTVVGTLGRGGMASVYLADDGLREERVAIKVLHAHLAHDPAMRRRLQREVVAAGLVKHEAALVAHDLHRDGDALALSMPYHGGTTLTERVRAEGPLSATQVRELGTRIAGALEDAHRKGVLHRDVTPNNVMLGDSPADAALTDFGLARTVDGNTATATSVLGTPGYAAPEIYNGQRTDPRSDLYSLGAVLYFAATGRSPFGAGNPAGVLQKQLQQGHTSVSEAAPGIPADLAATIEALLSKNPDHRPPSAGEIAAALASKQAALVAEVPDTWDAAAEPIVPVSADLVEPELTQATLPIGPYVVVAKKRSSSDAAGLAGRIGQIAGLGKGVLAPTRGMQQGQFRLTTGTDEATARRLTEAAQAAGFKARLYDTRAPTTVQKIASLAGPMVGVVWVAFPFLTAQALGGSTALFVSIALSILLPVLGGMFGKKELDEDLPLGIGNDIEITAGVAAQPGIQEQLWSFLDGLGLSELVADMSGTKRAEPEAKAKPAAKPKPKPKPIEQAKTRAEQLRGRAIGNLDLLSAAVAGLGDGLPTPARADLDRTVQTLRTEAAELSTTALALEVALEGNAEPEDTGWVHQRLTRLETLQRAGETVDASEIERLKSALSSAEAAAVARDELESQLTATLAQLLEIAATATRSRSQLLAGDGEAVTAELAVQRLKREVAAVDETRREMGRRVEAARMR